MSPSALHSGKSKRGERRKNSMVHMWYLLRPDETNCVVYCVACGKISPQ